MATNISPRRPVNGKQLRADRTRAMVIDETVRCVLEEGFGAASAKHITERAGVTWGVIQYHFGDRDGLLMAVVDRGFGDLLETLRGMEPELGSTSGHARAELVVNAVADAFLSPTSIAALEILIATRAGRADVDQQHLLELFSTLTRLGRYVADGLEPERADAVGNLIWSTLMGAMVAKMAVPGQSTSAASCVPSQTWSRPTSTRSAQPSASRRHGSSATSRSTETRGPAKKGSSSRTCLRASAARSSRIRSTIRCISGASNARIHS